MGSLPLHLRPVFYSAQPNTLIRGSGSLAEWKPQCYCFSLEQFFVVIVVVFVVVFPP